MKGYSCSKREKFENQIVGPHYQQAINAQMSERNGIDEDSQERVLDTHRSSGKMCVTTVQQANKDRCRVGTFLGGTEGERLSQRG